MKKEFKTKILSERVKVMAFISIINILVIFSNLILIIGSNPSWEEEPSVLYDRVPNFKWWMTESKGYELDYKYREVSDLINCMKCEDENIVFTYVNPYNNTVFVSIYNMNSQTIQKINDHVGLKDDVNIVFKNARATYNQLKQWKKIIWDNRELLNKFGVRVTMAGISVNGTITVGIQDISKDKVEIFKEIMRDKVPLGVLILHYGNAEFKGFLDQDDHHDTMIGGLKITSYSEGSGAWVSSTLGWYVTWYESGWKEGIIIAGYAACDDSTSLKKIYQPSRASSSYYVADFKKWGSTTNPTADVALCTLLSTEDGIPKVWKSTGWDKQVFGERTASQMSIGDYVEITGKTSGENSDAQIQDLSYDIDNWDYPYTNGLNDLVLVDPDWLPGDSGAPVYIKYPDQQAQIYMIYACGIVSGGIYINDVLTWCVYSSVENIETKLGFDLDFTTDR